MQFLAFPLRASRIRGVVATVFLLLVGSLLPTATRLAAQSPLLLPSAAAGRDLNSSVTTPFGDSVGTRVLLILDSSHFTDAGIDYTVAIWRLRLRVDASIARSWVQHNAPSTTVRMSTAARDYLSISTNLASNHGGDLTTLWTGTATIAAGSTVLGGPAPFPVNFSFSSPFVYTPRNGDLAIEIQTTYAAGSPPLDASTQTGVAKARAIVRSSATAFTAIPGEVCPAMELTVQRAGLFPEFHASTQSAGVGSTIQFTDDTSSSSPGGVTSWAWDFQDDGLVDSTQSNPTYAYPDCGTHSVRLTVTDAWHGTRSILKSGYITTAVPTDWGLRISVTDVTLPHTFRFTGTATCSTPFCQPPTLTGPWNWDFDGDGQTDAVGQSVTWTFPDPGPQRDVSLIVHHNGCTLDASQPFVPAFTLPLAGGGSSAILPSGATAYFDLDVQDPLGIRLTGGSATVRPYNFVLMYAYELDARVFLTEGSWQGKDTQPDAWQSLGTLSWFLTLYPPATGGDQGIYDDLNPALYIPYGRYGLAVVMTSPYLLGPYSLNNPVGYSSPGVVSLIGGGVRDAPFGGNFAPRGVGAALRYVRGGQTPLAAFGVHGQGCAGPLGTPRLAWAPARGPVLGQPFAVTVDRLPLSTLIMLIGLDHRMSPLGPLPIQIPGTSCSLRVSNDIPVLVPGSLNSATFNVTLPNDPAMLGSAIFMQGLALAPGANALGFVLSDAAGGLMGR